ncbi:MAG TPA: hypothetical protein VHI30_05355 [Gaiellales bacterium]|nr:hypothetical protein [Gaiellales bacterium]
MSSVPTAPTVYEVSELEEILAGEDTGPGDGDWYAIRTDPWPCPACGAEFDYVTACHHVIVAPDRDDLLDHAARASQVGRNPRLVLYDDVLPTMTLFQWRALGRPVHGIKKVS